ncbi:alpha/beta hydrolase family protein [Allorhodopirellula solitaria]|uniref:Alpha/beta hydrolase family protein n=1 Tax=Allorhodopirellula solitaria TaxID=2527987 RepID=A0A5C5XV71_9BACT|nr:dienelactone hydrolase [Allorhodopirellula solitaria]TWT67187.1 Alpha/beta hydrolase family protein [Allorhodopirellula solitaria]
MPTLASLTLLVPFFLLCAGSGNAADYDPLAKLDRSEVKTLYLDLTDAGRDRVIPLKVYLPASESAEPVVLFSHGLGGDREGSSYLGEHWSARGYVAITIQHPGSDSLIWKDKPFGQRLAGLRGAASPQSFIQRIDDVKVVIDRLSEWNRDNAHVLAGRLDLNHLGMSGHSFGALTTQAVSGQSAGWLSQSWTDTRINAAIAMSPSPPQRGDAKNAFGSVKIPWLLMTGSKDVSRFRNQSAESRLTVFPALPPGDKYELLLHNAEHSAFSDRALLGDTEPRNPNHHRAILAFSTAFWDAYLREDSSARTWLTGPNAREVLEQQDRLQMK